MRALEFSALTIHSKFMSVPTGLEEETEGKGTAYVTLNPNPHLEIASELLQSLVH